MAETATISGKISYNSVPGGPVVSPVLGSPLVNPTSASGPQLDYNEKVEGNYVVPAGGSVSVNFQTLSSAGIVYIGVNKSVDVVMNGGADIFTIEDGGFIMMYKSGITAISITGGPVESKVVVILLGD